MKMLHYTTSRFSIVSAVVLAVWSVLFYFVIIAEINDETDDSLEDYAELVITKHLSGQAMTSSSIGSNNQHFQREVSKKHAESSPHIQYEDRDVFIYEKQEYEPARVLTYIYRDNNDRYYELEVSTPTIDKAELQLTILQLIIALYIIIMCCILFINWWTVRSSIRPLERLLEWISRYRLGQTNAPLVSDTKIDEFVELNNAARENMMRNEKIFEEQKTFIGNASHELQTPLAICSNRIEIMMDDENLTESQMKQLVDLHRTIQRMTRLNRSLLMLSRIQNGQYANIAHVNFNELANSHIKELQVINPNRNIEIEDNGIFACEMDETLANTLISNLLRNAFAHSPQDGNVIIRTTRNSFSISNVATDGKLDESLIYQRFYHSTNKPDSTGLGLTIVQSICKNSGLSIGYEYTDGLHQFTIRKEPAFLPPKP